MHVIIEYIKNPYNIVSSSACCKVLCLNSQIKIFENIVKLIILPTKKKSLR